MALDVQPMEAAADPGLDVQPAALDVQPAALDVQPVMDVRQGGMESVALDPYQQADLASMRAGRGKAPDGMANTSDFLTAVARNPGSFLKSLPGDAAQVVEGVAATGLNEGEMLRRLMMGTPSRGVVKGDENGREVLTTEPQPLPFQPGRSLLAGDDEDSQESDAYRFARHMTTPGMLMAAPLAELKPVQGYFLSQTGAGAVDAAQRLLTPGENKSDAGRDLVLNLMMSGGLVKGLMKPAPAAAGETQTVQRQAVAPAATGVSEFGGDQAEAVAPVQTSGAGGKSEGAPTLAVKPVEAAQVEGETVRELPETISAQIDSLHAGKRPAVLLTHEDQVLPDWATKGKDGQYEVHETPAGRFLYDSAQLTKDQIDQAVSENRVGDILGYGISRKPAESEVIGAVVVRKANGVERQAVVTDTANLANVMAAAKRVAEPTDTISMERPEEVIAKRQPAQVTTSEQIRRDQAAEAVKAMNELRAQKGAAGAGELDVKPAEAPAVVAGEAPAKVLRVEVTPEEYKAAREGLPVGTPVATAQGLAKDIKRTQMFGEAWQTERAGKTEPMPANQLFVGDRFKLNGQPVKVEDLVTDAETVRPDHVRVSGPYGDQTIPADAVVHLDKGSLEGEGLGQKVLNALDSLKINKPMSELNFGIPIAAWNTIVESIKLAVRGGMAVKDAIDAGIAKLRASGIDLSTFDEDAAREHLLNNVFGDRETGVKVQASTSVPDTVKQEISKWVYEKRSNVVDAVVADGLVKNFGVDRAIAVFNHPPPGFPEAVRSQLIRSIGRELANQERQARAAGDEAAAAAAVQKAGEFWDDALARSTELAQGLQAMRAVTDFSPEAVVARTRAEIERQAQQELSRVSDQVQVMRAALKEGKSAGTEAVRADPEVNEAARKAVDEAVKESPEVKNAVVMELAQVWAQVPHILETARKLVGERANAILTRGVPPGLTAGQHFRRIADDLAKRAATIFAGHIQGGEPGVPLVKKLMDRLGLDQGKATQLATSLSKEWDAQLEIAKKKLDARLAWQRVRQLKREAEAQTDPLVDQAIRRQLRELNQKLGDALRTAAVERDALGKHIADRVIERSGLKGAKANALRDALKRRWDHLVGEGQRKALEGMAARAGLKVAPKLRSAFDKLVEIDRLGGLSDPKFLETVKTALKLKQLTAEDAARLRDLLAKAQSQPEGFLRDQAAAEVLKLTQQLKGEVSWRDVPMAIFYANVLSGITTPAKIAFENMNLLASTTVASFLSRPAEVLHPVDFVRAIAGAYKRGIVKGALQAQGTLRSGVVSGIFADAAHRQSVLEMKPFGAKMEALNFWKWFTRGISTAHELTFKPSWEIRQTLLAREMARKEGLSGKALDQRVADLMANTPAEMAKARAQALAELPGGNKLDVARRTREILERVREERMPGSTDSARDFALRTAYLNKPYGILGMVSTGVRSILEKARQEFPVAGTAAKTQIPFTTVVANILNEKLNWTPAGLVRAAISHKTGELYGREIIDPHERAELYAKAITGTLLVGALGELFGDHIHGNGPSDPAKRKQLQAAGWIPHSIEYNGRYYSYMNTPAALGLAILGNMMDWHRYGHGDAADGLARASFVTKATAQAIVSQGMLDSLRRFFEAVGSEDTTDGAGKLEKLAARTAAAFVVPNIVNQVDRFFDPTVYDAAGAKSLALSQVPFVRRENKPVLNVLGEPVESGPFHYWESKASDDVLWRVLAAKQAFIPEPAKQQILGNPKLGAEFARAMTPDEYYDWIARSGPAIRERLMDNIDILATADTAQAKALVGKITREERAKVRPAY